MQGKPGSVGGTGATGTQGNNGEKGEKVKKVNQETERKKVIVIIKGYMDASIHSKHLPVINLLLLFTYSVNPPPPPDLGFEHKPTMDRYQLKWQIC